MPRLRCNVCNHQFEWKGKMRPFACPNPECKSKGKGFAEVTGPAIDASDQPGTVAPGGGPGTTPPSPAPGLPEAGQPVPSSGSVGAAQPGGPSPPAKPIGFPFPKLGPSVAKPATAGPPVSPTPPPPAPVLPTAAPPGPPTVAARAGIPAPPRPRRDPDELAWRYPPPGAADRPGRPLRGCPAIDAQGRMFACVEDRLLMFAAGKQTPQWEYGTGGPIPRSPAIGPDGNVRVHSCDGYLHVVDPSGKQVFDPVAVGEPLGWASPLVDPQNNTWVCRCEGGLIKVDPEGHTDDRPFFRTRRRFDCTGLIHDDVLYLGCEDHYVYAIPLSGQRGENAWAGSPECGRTGCAINCALALIDGPQLLAASQDDSLHAFGLDGRELWATPMPGQMLGSPVVDHDGMVFVGISQNPRDRDARGMLVAVDRTSHQIKWQYPAGAPVESTPVIGDDGILYFGDNDGTIHAVDLQGNLVWKAKFEAPVRSPGTIVAGGLVAFGLDNGNLVVLKCSSQQLRAQGWPKLLRTLGQAGVATSG